MGIKNVGMSFFVNNVTKYFDITIIMIIIAERISARLIIKDLFS